MAAKKMYESFPKRLIEEVQRWGAMKQTGVSLRYMMEFGSTPTLRNLLISAQFLHKELPIRIARRAIELDSLPYGLSQKPAVLKVTPHPFSFLFFFFPSSYSYSFFFRFDSFHWSRFWTLGFISYKIME